MTRTLVTAVLTIVAACGLLLAEAQAHPAWGIVIDRQGQVYFSDLVNVWKIDAQGKLSMFRAGRDHTHDLNLDEAGNLYGAENSYDPATQRFFSAIWKMTPGGSSSYLMAPTENPPVGTSIWKDREGNMYRVDNYPERELLVLKRTPSGNVVVLAGNSNSVRNYRQGAPYSVGGIAFGSDGAFYFTHNADVSKISASGALTALARNVVVENAVTKPAEESRLFGIAVDAQHNAFVADYNNRRVLKIAPGGATSTVARAEQPWAPTGLALKDGNLYILEFGFTPPSTYTPRVRRLAADGKITVLATVGDAEISSAQITSSHKTGEGSSVPRRGASYAVIIAVVGIFVVAIAAWRARKRKLTNQEHVATLAQSHQQPRVRR